MLIFPIQSARERRNIQNLFSGKNILDGEHIECSVKINTSFLSSVKKKEYNLIIIVNDQSDLLYARLPHNNFHGGLYDRKEEWQSECVCVCVCVFLCAYRRERMERNNNSENEAERDARELTPNAVFYSVSRRIKHTDVLKRTRKQPSRTRTFTCSRLSFSCCSPCLFLSHSRYKFPSWKCALRFGANAILAD